MVGGITGVGGFGMGSIGGYYQSRLAENIHNARNAQKTGQGQLQTVLRKASSPETPVEPVRAVRPVSGNEASLPELTARLENDPAAMAGRMRMRYGDVDQNGVFVEAERNGGSPVQEARKSVLEGQLAQAEGALGRNDLKGAEDAVEGGAPKLPGMPEEKEEFPGMPKEEDAEKVPGLPGQKEDEGKEDGIKSARETVEDGKCETCEKRKYQDGSDDPGVSFKTPTNVKPEQAASAVRGHEMEHVTREQAKAEREGREVVSQNVTIHTGICPECGKTYVSGGTTRTVTKAAEDTGAEDTARQNQKATPFTAVA